MTVAIVTDSGSDLTAEELAEYGIRQVALSVAFGEKSYRSPDELPPDEFWRMIVAPGSPFPHTAAPSPAAFTTVFEQAFAAGAEGVVCVTLSETLSATIKSATMAREAMAGRPIEIVDSRSACMGIGALAIAGARMAREGASVSKIAESLRLRQRRVDLYVALETLEYLKKGGRISPARAAVGGLLSIKPIITIEEGVVVTADQPRTRAKAMERILELVTAKAAEEVHILYSPPADATAFREAVLAQMPAPAPARVTVRPIGPIIGAHIGPGAYGAILVLAE